MNLVARARGLTNGENDFLGEVALPLLGTSDFEFLVVLTSCPPASLPGGRYVTALQSGGTAAEPMGMLASPPAHRANP